MRVSCKIFNLRTSFFNHKGFTLIELVLVILILGILAITVSVKWPSGMKNEAAVLEFRRAVRYAQHKAITRAYTGAASAWGIIIDDPADTYTVRRRGGVTAENDYVNRSLPGDAAINSGTTEILFNGLGEPIDSSGSLLADTTVTIGTGSVLIYAETGYVE